MLIVVYCVAGMCHVPPIVRSQQWKLIRCAYKARCPACWLKMCLRSFQMPLSLKTSLANMLPENMKLSIVQSVNDSHRRLDSISKAFNWKPLIFENSFTRTNIFKTKMEKALEKYNSPLKLENKSEVMSCSKQKKLRITRMKTRRSSMGNGSAPQAHGTSTSDSGKRHKLELKGPRVKHVCRSASIVLGQPLATFPAENSSVLLPQCEPAAAKKNKEDESCDSCTVLNNVEVDDSFKNNHITSISGNDISNDAATSHDNPVTKIVTRPPCCSAGKHCRNYTNVSRTYLHWKG